MGERLTLSGPQAAASIGLAVTFCAVPTNYYSLELEERRALLNVRAPSSD